MIIFITAPFVSLKNFRKGTRERSMRVLIPNNRRGNKKLRRANIKREEARKERERFYKNFNYVGQRKFREKKTRRRKPFSFFFFITRLHSTMYARCSLNKMFVFLLHRQDASKRREHIGRVANGTRYTEAREEGGIKKKKKKK